MDNPQSHLNNIVDPTVILNFLLGDKISDKYSKDANFKKAVNQIFKDGTPRAAQLKKVKLLFEAYTSKESEKVHKKVSKAKGRRI